MKLVMLISLLMMQATPTVRGIVPLEITAWDPIPKTGPEAGDCNGKPCGSSGVDYILWGLSEDTYGPPLPVPPEVNCIEGATCTFKISWDTTLLPNGLKTVYVKAWDRRGNQSATLTSKYDVQNDNVGPTISIQTPADGATVSGQVNVAATANDFPAGLQWFQLWINGRQRVNNTTSAAITYRWNSNPERRDFATSTIEFRAQDKYGNTSSKKITVQVR